MNHGIVWQYTLSRKNQAIASSFRLGDLHKIIIRTAASDQQIDPDEWTIRGKLLMLPPEAITALGIDGAQGWLPLQTTPEPPSPTRAGEAPPPDDELN